MTDEPDHIVFYGSLRRGEANFERLGLGRRLGFVRPARIDGALYDLGDYPGLVIEARGQVQGELYRILDPSVLADLDAYELFRPGDPAPFHRATGRGSLYLRTAIPVGADRAFVYVLNGLPRSAPRVTGGDWLRHKALRRRR